MKILLVEDDISQRSLLRHIIAKKTSFEIFEAKNGIEGLRMVEMHSPDLIVLDVWMPVMNGMAMLEKLRADKMHNSIPVVIITAMKDQETIQEAIAKGISGYLLKPFTQEQVHATLSKFIPSFQAVTA
ncbi:MAG: response regulator [Bacteroidota bacterium]